MNGKRYFTEIKKRNIYTSIIFKAAYLFFYKITTHFNTLPPALHYIFKSVLIKTGVLFLKPFHHCRLHLFITAEALALQYSFSFGNRWKSLGARSGLYGGCGSTENSRH